MSWTPNEDEWREMRGDIRDIKHMLLNSETGFGVRLALLSDRVKTAGFLAYAGVVALATVVWEWLKHKFGTSS